MRTGANSWASGERRAFIVTFGSDCADMAGLIARSGSFALVTPR